MSVRKGSEPRYPDCAQPGVRSDTLPRLPDCAHVGSGNLPFALAYHRLGFSIFPTKPRTKAPAITSWKPWQKRRPDEDQVRSWFADTDPERVGIAIVCGKVSGGLLVRDFDKKPAYEAWRRSNPELTASIPTVTTSRGCHVYARWSESASRVFGDGELRGDGLYVIAPPSIHGAGSRYSWLTIPEQIPLVDPSVFGIPSTKTNATQEVLVSVLHGLKLSGDVLAAIRETLPIGPGQRHRQLFQFVRRLRCLSQYQDCTDPWRLRPLVEAWHAVALPMITTKDFETTMADFVRGWPLVRLVTSIEKGARAGVEKGATWVLKNAPEWGGNARCSFLRCGL